MNSKTGVDVKEEPFGSTKKLNEEEIEFEEALLCVEFGPDENKSVCDGCKKPLSGGFFECEGICKRIVEEYYTGSLYNDTEEYTEPCRFCTECSKSFEKSAGGKWICKSCSKSLLLPKCKKCKKVVINDYPGFMCECGETEIESLM